MELSLFQCYLSACLYCLQNVALYLSFLVNMFSVSENLKWVVWWIGFQLGVFWWIGFQLVRTWKDSDSGPLLPCLMFHVALSYVWNNASTPADDVNLHTFDVSCIAPVLFTCLWGFRWCKRGVLDIINLILSFGYLKVSSSYYLVLTQAAGVK